MAKQKDIDAVMQSINATCRGKGGKYAGYSCMEVSWDDVQRGQVDGELSCWGANITDTRLYEKEGARLFTVRSDNWNEKLGKLSADKIALLVGNHVSEMFKQQNDLETVSLEKFLKNAGLYGSYAGVPEDKNLSDDKLDTEISIRFQTTFLPVKDEEKATLEFASEAYNYNTTDDDDPRNLLLLCTTQGTAVQQDGAGAKKLYHHRIDEDRVIHRHWLEAERTKHKVGGPQKETTEERADAKARGKATSELIGTESLGSRFNVLMTIQVPLKQKRKPKNRGGFVGGGPVMYCCAAGGFQPKMMMKCAEEDFLMEDTDFTDNCRMERGAPPMKMKVGQSNAARVSRGSEVDTWDGLTVENPERHPSEHITVTVVIYNTIAGGVPAEDDVIAAIDDMEQLYESCTWTGRLADDGASFMKSELTVKDMMDIKKKITTQPHPDWPKPMIPGGGCCDKPAEGTCCNKSKQTDV